MRKIILSALLLASTLCFSQPSELLELAKQGDVAAQNNLGDMFKDGRGVAQNDTEAMQWYRRAAEQGDAEAQYNLGKMFYERRGFAQNRRIAQNDAEAVQWYQRAAEQGHALAQNNLGSMISMGLGVTQSHEQAYFWLLLAGEHEKVARKNRDSVQKFLSPSQVTKLQAQAAAWKPRQP